MADAVGVSKDKAGEHEATQHPGEENREPLTLDVNPDVSSEKKMAADGGRRQILPLVDWDTHFGRQWTATTPPRCTTHKRGACALCYCESGRSATLRGLPMGACGGARL